MRLEMNTKQTPRLKFQKGSVQKKHTRLRCPTLIPPKQITFSPQWDGISRSPTPACIRHCPSHYGEFCPSLSGWLNQPPPPLSLPCLSSPCLQGLYSQIRVVPQTKILPHIRIVSDDFFLLCPSCPCPQGFAALLDYELRLVPRFTGNARVGPLLSSRTPRKLAAHSKSTPPLAEFSFDDIPPPSVVLLSWSPHKVLLGLFRIEPPKRLSPPNLFVKPGCGARESFCHPEPPESRPPPSAS